MLSSFRHMIKSFRHRGLKKLYVGKTQPHVDPAHVEKLKNILTELDHRNGPEGMNLPGFQLHRLKGQPKERYAVSVSGNWRVTFQFESGMAIDVNYCDYH